MSTEDTTSRNYEFSELDKEQSWHIFRIMGELVNGFDKLAGIGPAVTMYGSAQPEAAQKYYGKAEQIAYLLGKLGFTIITGGGPGIMEAANKGASEAGSISIGLNIELPKEQKCNDYSTKTITFNHFFARKVMLVKYATAFIIMPGGLGTLDELTEVLVLIQTYKIKPFPVILYGSSYWGGFLDWLQGSVLEGGFISRDDVDKLIISDDPQEIVNIIQSWYIKHSLVGKRAVNNT